MEVNNWIYNNLFRLVNSTCPLCGSKSRSRESLCTGCQADIQSAEPVCRRCAVPLNPTDGLECGACQKDPPLYRSVYCFAPYAAPLDRLILQFKFQQKLYIGKKLGALMAQDIMSRQLPQPDVLLPIPLHSRRLRQRGYNQALELARPIATELGVSLDFNNCVRTKETTEQIGLSAKLRRSNLKGAFELKDNFQGKRVAIVDDVMTTGSTVSELSRQLLQAGATSVDVWVCARAVF